MVSKREKTNICINEHYKDNKVESRSKNIWDFRVGIKKNNPRLVKP